VPDHTELEGETVLVTGGHGFIGRHVVTALDRAGAKPVSVSQHDGETLADLPGRSYTLDLERAEGVSEALRGVDSVIHLAARAGGIQFQQAGGDDIFDSNRRITDNLLATSADSGIQRVFLASSLVTYLPATEPLTELHRQLGPGDRPNPYAWSKITDEVVASWHQGLHTVVGRFGNVYGPGAPFDPERSTVVHALIDRASRLEDGEDLVVWGDGSAIRSFVFVEDVAEAVLVILSRGESGEAYNIDGGIEVTIAELATIVRDTVNPSLDLVFDATKPAGPPFRVASIDKLTTLGYAPRVDLAEGLRRTVDWYREAVLAPP
jgi:nucleoside-diphosphate-sugar epimerase